jgi:hypothetical protein
MSLIRFPGSSRILNRILADPALPERIRALDGLALARLIDHVGLEDCGEIVALATTEQLQQVFDHDIWKSSRPGGDDVFDPERFVLWLEVLLELGSTSVAERLSEMDQDFLNLAFSQLLWVVRFEDLRGMAASEAGLEKIMESSHYHELEDYFLFSRQPRSWDAVLSAIVALDTDHHSLLIRILEACSHVTNEVIEESNGLHSVLTAEEQLNSDVAYEREKRREAQGYVTPADARAFLKLAAGPVDAEDHISPKRFRQHGFGTETQANPSSRSNETPPVLSNLSKYARVQSLLASDVSLRKLRMEELNYLANVLVSGGSIQGRSYRPGEAAQVVLETCERGLTRNARLVSLIEAFRTAWAK